MKKNILTMMLFAVAAIASVSCQKEAQNEPAQPVTLTFTSANPETKTEWNEENQTIWWSEKDKIRVACTADGKWQDGNGDVAEGEDAKFYESAGLKVSEVTAKFVVPTDYKKENVGEKECQFYAVYPSSAVKLNFKASVADVTIPSLQTSTLSFPNAADILYGKSVEPHTGLPESSISMSWNRLVAHAYITLKGINGIAEKETINSITLTAQEGAALTGEFNLNVATDEFTADATSNVVTVNCTDIVADASGNVTFWACINPCTVTSLNIVVDTDRAVYTIDKTGLNCEFLVNKRNVLPVNMSAAVRTPKDLTGAALPFEETFESVTTTSTNSQLTSLDGFLELSRIYPNSGSVKFSASSESGKMVTKLLDLSSAFFVRILSKGWDSDEVTLTVEAGQESKDITMITHGDTGDFVEYVVNFDGIDNSESITITTPGGKRAFVDNIYIGEGAAVAAPVIVAQTPDKLAADAASVAIKYSVYNPVEGKTLTASTEADWLTEVQYVDGTVTYNVAANTEDERNATVTLSYEGATPVEVVVTQAADAAPSSDVWALVTDASTLAVGNRIVIVAANEYNYAMGSDRGNNRDQVGIEKVDNNITITSGVQILTLEAGSIDNTFAFNTGTGYLCAASSSYNYLRTKNIKDDDASWIITIENGVAKLWAQGTYTRNIMRYNSSSGLFSCYASGQKDISIYKLQN